MKGIFLFTKTNAYNSFLEIQSKEALFTRQNLAIALLTSGILNA